MDDTTVTFETIKTRLEKDTAWLQIHRPENNNTINSTLIRECLNILKTWEDKAKVIVLEGLPQVFCYGADFQSQKEGQDPASMYDLWLRLAEGPFLSIAKVRGRVNAGGVGFVAACDQVLAESTATFSLSELLFSLMPACVLPFLIRRTGYQKAHHMTVMTHPFSAEAGLSMGLVDAVAPDVDELLRKHMLRLRLLNKRAVTRYKSYMSSLYSLEKFKTQAVEANRLVFGDPEIQESIRRFVTEGKMPWETSS